MRHPAGDGVDDTEDLVYRVHIGGAFSAYRVIAMR
jgi:hypothetical protein